MLVVAKYYSFLHFVDGPLMYHRLMSDSKTGYKKSVKNLIPKLPSGHDGHFMLYIIRGKGDGDNKLVLL